MDAKISLRRKAAIRRWEWVQWMSVVFTVLLLAIFMGVMLLEYYYRGGFGNSVLLGFLSWPAAMLYDSWLLGGDASVERISSTTTRIVSDVIVALFFLLYIFWQAITLQNCGDPAKTMADACLNKICTTAQGVVITGIVVAGVGVILLIIAAILDGIFRRKQIAYGELRQQQKSVEMVT